MTNECLNEEIYTTLPLNSQLPDDTQSNQNHQHQQHKSLRFKKNIDIEPNELAYVKFDHTNKYARLNQIHSFLIYTRDNAKYEPKLIIKNINSNLIEYNLLKLQNGIFKCEFIPYDIDEYSIDIYYKNTLIDGCPFKCYSYDPLSVKIHQILYAFIGKQAKFEVDTRNAGCGDLEIGINNGQVSCSVNKKDKFRYIVYFMPQIEGNLSIRIKFNDCNVPDGDFNCYSIDLSKISLKIPHGKPMIYPIGKQISFDIYVNHHLAPNISAYVINPCGKHTKIKTSSFENDSFMRIYFKTSDIGNHRLELTCLDERIPNGPYEFKIFDHNKVRLGEIEGLEVGKKCEFTIDSSEAGEGSIEISINNGHIRHQVKQLNFGYYLVSFIPDIQEYYSIDCKFNELQIPGCPKFAYIKEIKPVKIIGDIKNKAALAKVSSFLIDNVADINKLKIKITPPSQNGSLLPKITKLSAEKYRVEWIPYELGVYMVKISYGDQEISDLAVKIFDPNQVRVFNIRDGLVNHQNTFTIDAQKAGEGDLEIGIKCGDQIVPNQVRILSNSQFEVSFIPKRTLDHYATVSFNGIQIQNSPFEFKIRQIASLRVTGSGVSLTPINRQAKFKVFLDKNEIDKLSVRVKDPENEILFSKISPTQDNLLECEYNPVVIGKHQIEVYYMNMQINESPFYSHVFDLNHMKITKLPKELICDFDNQIEVNMRHVGSDNLTVHVFNCKSGNEIETRIDGTWLKTINFRPKDCDTYTLIFKIGHYEVKQMNLPCVQSALHADPSKVEIDLSSFENCFIDDEIRALVDTKRAGPGELTAQCNGTDKPAYCEFIDNDDATFTLIIKAQQLGTHTLQVLYNGNHITNSPHTFNILNKWNLDIAKIRVYGPGILDGILSGYQSQFYIDTNECKSNGQLAVNVRGPKNKFRIEMKRTSLKDRIIQCMYDPRDVGQYLVSVQWNGQNVIGSPFKVNIVSNDSDLKKL